MRKLLIVVGALVLLFGAAVAAGALWLNRVVASNNDVIIQQAQALLGRQISVARISVGLWNGIAVQLEDVRIADDARFGSEDFVRVATLRVRAKLWPLLQQRFDVSRITAAQPVVNLVRDAQGRWNYTTLRPLSPPQHAAVAPGIILAANPPTVSAPLRPLPFVVGHLSITDGTLVVVDHTQEPTRTTQVTHLDAALGYSGPTAPLAVSVAAAVAGDRRNIDVHGSVGPWNQSAGVPLQLDGTLGPLGPDNVEVDALHVTATLAAQHVQVTELTGRSFHGGFALSGDFAMQGDPSISLKGTAQDLAIAEIVALAADDATPRLSGTAHLTMNVRGSGTTQQALQASLTGSLGIDIQDGVIAKLNIANEVIGHADDLPIIGAALSARIKAKHARLFASPDTHFETAHATFTIAAERLETEDLAIVAADYGVVGRGWIGFNRQADLAGTLRLSRPFTDEVVADVKEARYLLDDHAQLAVPFHLRGRLGDAKPRLDRDDVMALLQRGVARGGAKDLIDRLLGPKRQATPAEAQDPLERGLRRLFGH